MQEPLWLVIAALFVGPALSAAILNYFLGRRQKDRDAKQAREMEDYKAALKSAADEKGELAERKAAARQEYDAFVREEIEAINRAYAEVFIRGKKVSPKELGKLIEAADEALMLPLRRNRQRLSSDVRDAVTSIHNRLSQALPPDGSQMSARTIDQLWQIRDRFYDETQRVAIVLEISRESGWRIQ
jgi:hypothetical protein